MVDYHIGGKFGELTLFEHLAKGINTSANRLLIVSTNLDGFSLASHRRFAKLSAIKLSSYTVCKFGQFHGQCSIAVILCKLPQISPSTQIYTLSSMQGKAMSSLSSTMYSYTVVVSRSLCFKIYFILHV